MVPEDAVLPVVFCQSECRGEVTLDDIEFTYPSRPDAIILRGLTVSIKPGQRVALVGQSGCGKSTCVSLVERFYDTSRGCLVSRLVTCYSSTGLLLPMPTVLLCHHDFQHVYLSNCDVLDITYIFFPSSCHCCPAFFLCKGMYIIKMLPGKE